MKELKLIALLVITLLIKSTAFTQTTSTDSVICFTYEQVRQITKDLKKGTVDAEIVQHQELQIINFKQLSIKNDVIILENNKRILQLTKDIKTANSKLKISKRLTTFGIPIALGGGLFLGILLVK